MKITRLKKMTMMAMFSAMAYVVMSYCRIPMFADAPYLQYDPKDIIIVIAAFIAGPFAGILISVVVSLVEMLTVSETGPIGMIMNVIATVCFVWPAAMIYKKRKTFIAAVIGLAISVVAMTAAMLLWNYLITPFYQGVDRAVIKQMLIPIFLPFNLIKAGINMGITLVLYKPVILALRKSGLFTEQN